jgi:DNA-binding Lrp family transcriptional regulator
LCNELQKGLPVRSRPFDDLARFLGSDEETILRQIAQLKKDGFIRRISTLINHRALGKTSTLAAAHVPQENLQEVTQAVNSLEGVSHNYLRKHHYNLWFTLQGRASEEIALTLSNLSGRFGIDFHSLPITHVFKLDVRFDAEDRSPLIEESVDVPKSEKVQLSESEKRILSKLQQDLQVTAKPFEILSGEGFGSEEVLQIIQALIDKGAIRRIAAVVDYRKLGFVHNVLFVSDVPEDRVIEAGERLARFRMVSHCYERKTFEGWPYNLFAMMHAKSMGDIQRVIDKFIEAEGIESFELLPTVEELKKRPVKHRFGQ